ncbi:TRAP transporter small permease [Ponticoccus sp. (in: a-proteobacteria)]|uniref:TRAP transporter small permease n=1 Tax=Ponticoccus sp. (in: a-proteobacteria) TaxID=1925025 RepID=UPI003AB172A8
MTLPPDRLRRLDARLARAETALSAGLLGVMLACMAAGAAMRSLGQPLVWADELAVLTMAGAAFFGAAACLAEGGHLSVDLLRARLCEGARRGLARVVDAALLLLLLGFAACLWTWLDPVGLIAAGSGAALAQESFNFTYTEPTMTLGLAKVWFWLPMVPATLGAIIHVVLRLAGQGGRAC